MRFKAQVHVSTSTKLYPGSGGNMVMTCPYCGYSADQYSSGRSTTPQWTFGPVNNEEGWYNVESSDATCREILFSRLVDLAMYIDGARNLKLTEASYLRTQAQETAVHPVTQVVEDIANGFWLGLSESNNRFAYEPGRGVVSMPVEFLDWSSEACGPMFSICGHFLKSGANAVNSFLQDSLGNNGHTLNNAQIVELGQPLANLIHSESPLTTNSRREILRETCRILWTGLNGGPAGYSDYHNWVKYAVLWHALGGLKGISPDLGFTYYRIPEKQVSRLHKSQVIKPPDSRCGHKPERSYCYNGSLSFFSQYFLDQIDGRTVQRFLDGGSGMLKRTAQHRIRYQLWQK